MLHLTRVYSRTANACGEVNTQFLVDIHLFNNVIGGYPLWSTFGSIQIHPVMMRTRSSPVSGHMKRLMCLKHISSGRRVMMSLQV